jgi:hypothetical protein
MTTFQTRVITVREAWYAMEEGEELFSASNPVTRGPRAIVDFVPIRSRTGRLLFWVVFDDGRMRIMDGDDTVYMLRLAA